MARHSTDLGLSEHEVSVLRRREDRGWFVNRIAGDTAGSGFAYSFGLFEEFGHPEVIIFGLPGQTMHQLINDVGDQIQAGHKYSAGAITADLLRGHSCAFRRVNPLQYKSTFTWAVWFYENYDFTALQLFWPDKNDRFPWDPEFREQLRPLQPDLSLQPAGDGSKPL